MPSWYSVVPLGGYAFYTDRNYSGVMNKEMMSFLEKNKQTVPAGLAEVCAAPLYGFDVNMGAEGGWDGPVLVPSDEEFGAPDDRWDWP